MARAQASDGGVGGRGGDDSGDGEDEVDLTGIATKEEKQAGTSGAWQTDVEKFLGMWDLFFFFLPVKSHFHVPGHKTGLERLCS